MKLKPIAFILLAALLGYSAYWLYISQHTGVYLRSVLADLAENKGVIATFESYEVSGFPYRLVLDFEQPVITYRNGPLHAELRAGSMQAVLQPWNLGHVILLSEDAALGLSFAAGAPKRTTLNPSHLEISVSKNRSGTFRLSAEMEGATTATTPEGLIPDHLSKIAFHLRKFDIDRAGAEGQLFEPRILEIALIAEHEAGRRFETELSFRGEDVPKVERAALALWRDQGGTLEVEHFELNTGAITASGSGSFTLDQDFRLLGAVDLEGVASPAVVAFFTAQGWMSEENGEAVLDFFRSMPAGATDTPLALSAQDGYLMLGPVRFEEIGPVIPEEN